MTIALIIIVFFGIEKAGGMGVVMQTQASRISILLGI